MPKMKLSKLELQILEALWAQGKASIREIQEAFPEPRPASAVLPMPLLKLGPPQRQTKGSAGASAPHQRPRILVASRTAAATPSFFARAFTRALSARSAHADPFLPCAPRTPYAG